MPNKRVDFGVDVSPIKRLQGQLKKMDDFLALERRIMARAARQITPLARQLLLAAAGRQVNLQHSKQAGDKTKHLREMIEAVEVKPTKYGVWLQFAGRAKGFSKKDFAKAGALQYGALRGSDLVSRKRREAQKRKIQERNKRAGSMTATEAKDFYALDAGQIAQLAAAFEKAISDQIVALDKVIARAS